MTLYRRFESAVPNQRGTHPGVFALANGLAGDGRLCAVDFAWWEETNARATKAYIDPTTVRPDCYDTATNPGARSWFKESAVNLIEMTSGYLRLLDRYGVPWVELRTAHPGRVTYEDNVQVVAVPLGYPEDWPFVERLPG